MDDNGGSGRPADGRPGEGGGQWVAPGYTHERELGSGASGRVVLARHDATGTAVAIKYLAGRLDRDHRFRAAFRGEARLLGDIDSPYVARFYEYVEDGPDAAIVMELVDGIALRTLLRQEGATDPEPALTVLKGSLLGLAAAHAAGVVHRDYKPGNVLVTTDGRSKLVDFGVAVRSGESGDVAGTPSYMAPEQWAGGPATPATDVYAATATFYECLTGTKPYSGSTMFELAVQHAEAPVPDEQVPELVRSLVSRGLGKTPQERPQSAAEFVAELQAVASAAYGEDWEERGQRKLAALVALFPLLLPSAAGGASGTTALAHTRLAGGAGGAAEGAAAAGAFAPRDAARRPRSGRRAKLLVGAVAGVLISAGLTVTAVANGGSRSTPDAAATPSALTSLTPGPPAAPAAGPSTGGSPSASPSATPSAAPTGTPSTAPPTTAAAGPTATPTTAAAGPTATGTPTPALIPTGSPAVTTTAPTAAPTTSSAPPPLHVISVSIPRFGCSGNSGYTALGTVTVQSDGAAAGTLTLSWFHSSTKGPRGSVTVATESVPLAEGQQSFTSTYSHGFGSSDTYPYWGLSVSTTPAADSGNGSYQVVAACGPIIF